MIHRSSRRAGALGTPVVCLLVACAAPAPAPDAQTATRSQAGTAAAGETIIGSRIPRKSTDRLVRQTDQAGAKDMERHRPPETGPLNNQ